MLFLISKIANFESNSQLTYDLDALGKTMSLLLSNVETDEQYMDLQEILKPLTFLSRDFRNLISPISNE